MAIHLLSRSFNLQYSNMREKLTAVIAFVVAGIFVFDGLTFPDAISMKRDAFTAKTSPVRLTREQKALQFKQGTLTYNVQCDLNSTRCEPGGHGSGSPIDLQLAKVGAWATALRPLR